MRTVSGFWVVLALGALGCGGSGDVNIGNDGPEPTGTLGESLSDYEGSWEGYIEGYSFPDGSDLVRLTLDEEGNGTLVLGNDTDPLPAPDPDAAPPGWDNGMMAIAPTMLLGHPFEVDSATLQSKRIKLATSEPEAYQEWCALQTPVLDEVNTEEPTYWCVRNVGYISMNGEMCFEQDTNEPVPCGKLLCQQLCACTSTACSWIGGTSAPSLDAALDSTGESLVGTLVSNLPGTSGSVTVRLERQ
jgi:hypothetical protein